MTFIPQYANPLLAAKHGAKCAKMHGCAHVPTHHRSPMEQRARTKMIRSLERTLRRPTANHSTMNKERA